MAVNSQQRSGLLQVVTDPAAGTGVQRIAPRSADWRMPSSGVEEAFASTERAASKISDELADVGREIGKYADHAARIEGERAGHQAGMNPDFQPTRAITIRGEAYDKAGLETYKSQVSVEIENDIQAGGNLAKKRDAWLARVPEELRPDVAYVFRRGELAQARTAAREHQARISAEATAALQTELDTELKGLHQRAYALGNDPTADQVLGRDIARIDALLARKGVDGKPLADAGAAEKIRRQAKEAVVEARILGEFDRLPDNAQRLSFIDRIDQDFRNSEGLSRHLDLKEYQRITGKLRAEFRAAQFEERQSQAAVDGEVKALGAMVEKGYLPTDAQLAGARGRAAAVKNPALADRMAVIEDTLAFQREYRSQPPEVSEAYAASLRRYMAEKGPTPEGVARVELAEKLAKETRKELRESPNAWGDRVGLPGYQPIDVSSDDGLAASLRARVPYANAIGEHFGQPPRFLDRDEAHALAVRLASGGDDALRTLATIDAASGGRMREIVAELNHDGSAPKIAKLAGLVSDVGLTSAARDAAKGMKLRNLKDREHVSPKDADARLVTSEVLGTSLSGLPGEREATVSLARDIFEARALRADIDGKAWGSDAKELWRQSLRDALGERTLNNKTYGGVVAQSGWWSGSDHIVLPPTVAQKGWRQVIDMITPEDLAAAGIPLPVTGDDKPISIERIKAGTLMQFGPGQYAVSVSNKQGVAGKAKDPQTGEEWVLDLNRLAPILARRRADLFHGAK